MVKLVIKSLDLCGSIVGLMYKGKRSYHSITGGILSIVLMMGMISILVTYLDSFISRKKPKMTFEDKKYYAPPLLNITENFSFAVMTKYGGGNEIRKEIVKVDAVFKEKNGTNWASKQMDSIPCKPNQNSSLEVFNRLELSKGACFNISGLSLQGSQVTEILQLIQIRFRLCLNESDCYPEQKMIDLFYEMKPVAIVYFVDAAFQIYNTSNRVAEFYNYFDINLTYQNNKETNIFFSYNELLVDEHYFFPGDPANYSRFMIESSQDRGAIRSEQEKTVLSINLMSSNYKSIISVSYMQITELFANICSLVNILIIIICSIGNYFNQYLFQSDLINSFYESEYPTDDPVIQEANRKIFNFKENMKRRSSPNTPFEKKLSNNNFFFARDVSPLNKTQNAFITQSDQSVLVIDSFRQSINQQQKLAKYEFNQHNIIKMLFMSMIPCNFNKQHREYKTKFKQINQSLSFYQDLKNVFRKLMEIDLLKYLLLTEEQLTMYQIVPKPQFRKPNNARASCEFASLINNPNFHFLKSKKYIDKALNNPINRELFASRMTYLGNDNKLYDKLLGLITK